jgi:hypothetical protein
VPVGGTLATRGEAPKMNQSSMPRLYLVAVAERRAATDAARPSKRASVGRGQKIVYLFDQPRFGRVIPFPDRTPPGPAAA